MPSFPFFGLGTERNTGLAATLEETKHMREARLLLIARIIALPVGNGCAASVNVIARADITTANGRTLTADVGNGGDARLIFGGKAETRRMIRESSREVIQAIGREIMKARARQQIDRDVARRMNRQR